MRKRWFSSSYLVMLVFALLWNGMLAMMIQRLKDDPELPEAAYAIPFIHGVIGLGLLYTALAGLLNSTTVAASERGLRVRRGPLPWRGNLRVPKGAIDQLYAVPHTFRSPRRRRRRRRGSIGVDPTPRSQRPVAAYDVVAETLDGVVVPLVCKLRTPEQAARVERVLEDRLEIPDRPRDEPPPAG